MLEKKKKIDTHFQFSVWYISFLWKLGHNYICKQRFAKHRLHMFDTNFISVLYFEWWARLPSAWLQVQSLLGVSEECLNLLSVSKNHHHIKRSRYTSHVKVAFRITWYFQRIPTLTARLHCTFKAKHVASFFHRAILHLKNKKGT